MAECPCGAVSADYDSKASALENIPHNKGCRADVGSLDYVRTVKFSGSGSGSSSSKAKPASDEDAPKKKHK